MTHPCYSVVELTFPGPADAIPADRVPLTVRFSHPAGQQIEVPGFADGGDRYLVRFAPEVTGRWSYRSSSAAVELDGEVGEFEVGPAADGEHGPVRVAARAAALRQAQGTSAGVAQGASVGVARETSAGVARGTSGGESTAELVEAPHASRFHFEHADGTPFRPVGGTVYNWLHQPGERRVRTVESLAAAGFNKLRFMIFPQAGGYVEHFPELLPFERTADRSYDVARPVIDFFRRLDDAVRLLHRYRIQAEVLIFNAYDNDRFGLDRLTAEQDATYQRYLVARLSAFPNVWWSLCNEFDLLDRPIERWDAAGEQLAAADAHDHLRSIHNWTRFYDHNQPWVTHASIQLGQATEDFGRASLLRDAYRKPVVLDEIKYEGDVPQRWGHLTARQLVHQFWISTVSGCYASHGESFVLDDGSLHLVAGGDLQGESPSRLGFLRRLLDEVDGPGLDPIDNWWDPAFVAGIPGEIYLQYLGDSAPPSWTFRLPQGSQGARLQPGDRFSVELINTWQMTITPASEVFELTEVERNNAYADGEPIELPEGEPIALRIRRHLP